MKQLGVPELHTIFASNEVLFKPGSLLLSNFSRNNLLILGFVR